jgi:hypothetical protein
MPDLLLPPASRSLPKAANNPPKGDTFFIPAPAQNPGLLLEPFLDGRMRLELSHFDEGQVDGFAVDSLVA